MLTTAAPDEARTARETLQKQDRTRGASTQPACSHLQSQWKFQSNYSTDNSFREKTETKTISFSFASLRCLALQTLC